MTRLPAGSLVITIGKEGPHWEAKWRWEGRQIKRRLGHAWLDRNGSGWVKRAGRAPEGFLSEQDAIVAMRSMIATHAAEEAQEGREKTPTFLEAAEHWYRRAERRQRKPATLLAYRWLINAHLIGKRTFESTAIKLPCPFKDKPIDRVSKHDMRDWFDPIPQSPQKANLFKVVKSICTFAVNEGWTTENVARHVDCRPTPDDGSYDYFTAGEIESLIAAARDEYDACLYAAAAYTGLRKGELFALQWGDIDFERARVVVKRNYSGRELVTPKNGKTRVVPLVPALATRFKELQKHVGQTCITVPRATPIFPGSSDAAMVRYRKTLKRAELRRLSFHSLRHSFGSHAVTVATLVQVRDWLGHSDLRMTARYLHARSLDSDADLLGGAF